MGRLADILKRSTEQHTDILSPEENERRRIAFQKFAEQRRKIQHEHVARQKAARKESGHDE